MGRLSITLKSASLTVLVSDRMHGWESLPPANQRHSEQGSSPPAARPTLSHYAVSVLLLDVRTAIDSPSAFWSDICRKICLFRSPIQGLRAPFGVWLGVGCRGGQNHTHLLAGSNHTGTMPCMASWWLRISGCTPLLQRCRDSYSVLMGKQRI